MEPGWVKPAEHGLYCWAADYPSIISVGMRDAAVLPCNRRKAVNIVFWEWLKERILWDVVISDQEFS